MIKHKTKGAPKANQNASKGGRDTNLTIRIKSDLKAFAGSFEGLTSADLIERLLIKEMELCRKNLKI